MEFRREEHLGVNYDPYKPDFCIDSFVNIISLQLGISQLSTLRRYTDRGERLQRQNSETITSAIQERYIDNRNKNKDKNQT